MARTKAPTALVNVRDQRGLSCSATAGESWFIGSVILHLPISFIGKAPAENRSFPAGAFVLKQFRF
jgi:hypothetical protein